MARRPVVKVRVERRLYEQAKAAADARGVPVAWLVARFVRVGLQSLAGDTTFLWTEKDPDVPPERRPTYPDDF